MRAICLTSIAVLGLAANAAVADGPDHAAARPDADSELTPAAEALLREFEIAAQIQLSDEVPPLVNTDAFATPLTGLELSESNAIGRAAGFRRFSLLTLAEVGKAELFFGVSSNGTLGLHFGATSRQGAHDDARSAQPAYTSSGPGL